jgi:prolyl oligopeptidase PreP (S9A serine peptidase family)
MVRNVSELIIAPANNRSKSAAAAREDADPYRWLEDSASPETAAWVTAQNQLTQAYLAGVPVREVVRSRLTERWDFARSGVPFERGGRWFAVRDALNWCKSASAEWEKDGSGIYYAAMTPPRLRV